jgi:hypothetical protein
MEPEPDNDTHHTQPDAARIVYVCLFACVGVVALLALVFTDEQWGRWARIGDAFGTLAAIVAVVTVATAVTMSARQQRQVNRTMLHQNHADLIGMALAHPHLAEVWRMDGDTLTTEEIQQRLYAYQILQDIFAYLKSGEHSEAQASSALARVFQSPIVRDVWQTTARERAEVVKPGTAEHAFYQLANEAHVLATRPPVNSRL